MIGHALAGNTVREKYLSDAYRLLKNCQQARTTEDIVLQGKLLRSPLLPRAFKLDARSAAKSGETLRRPKSGEKQ
jgi:hypothetical protein